MDGSRETETAESGQFEESDSEYEDVRDNPIVFQCKKCRTILGDSTSWLGANEELSVFALRRVTSKVSLDSKLTMSQKGPDLGSTFYSLSCSKCHQEIGKMYKTTPQVLDDLRDVYSLLESVVDSYAVGSGSVEAMAGEASRFLSVDKLKFLFDQFKKMQTLMLMLNNRVTALEQSLMQDGEGAESSAGEAESADERLDLTNAEMGPSNEGRNLSSVSGKDISTRTEQNIHEHHQSKQHSSSNKSKRKTVEPEQGLIKKKRKM